MSNWQVGQMTGSARKPVETWNGKGWQEDEHHILVKYKPRLIWDPHTYDGTISAVNHHWKHTLPKKALDNIESMLFFKRDALPESPILAYYRSNDAQSEYRR